MKCIVCVCVCVCIYIGFSGGSDYKESRDALYARDPGLVPGPERSAREGNGYPLQYSCLQNPMNSGAWWATVHGLKNSQT